MPYRADNICINCGLRMKPTRMAFNFLLMCQECIDKEAYLDWAVKIVESDRDISGNCDRIYCSPDCSNCCIPIIRAQFRFIQEYKNSSDIYFDKYSKKLSDTKGI